VKIITQQNKPISISQNALQNSDYINSISILAF